ncbi:MAG: LacI family DNA-binding transcriptional regulator [Chloroflexi bacterium]|nr:LacI family DNA-binding transcriptional regulator [Chloroflexota bacterium]
MRKTQVTAQQVAERAGVSLTTVSFVMNNKTGASISEATRLKVLDAAEELGYFPHITARSLARGRTSNIGLLLFRPHQRIFIDPFMPNLITGFSEIANQEGYRLLVQNIDDSDIITPVKTMLRGGEVAGLVVAGFDVENGDMLLPLIKDGYPVVPIDPMNNPAISYVSIDHPSGVKDVIYHLIRLNHTKIGCITYGPFNRVKQRLQAYRQALESSGIAYDEGLIREGQYDPETGYLAALSLLRERPDMTAIFGMNDMMALGALSAIHESGLRVPQDIAVVGYDDMRFSPYLYPRLTTVRAPEVELGRQAAIMVLDQIRGTLIAPKYVSLKSELIIRDTCGAS